MRIASFAAALALAVQAQRFDKEELLETQFDFFARYEELLNSTHFQTEQPVVGILTMPVWDDNMYTEDFEYPHFVWEHNVNFVHYAGTWAVPIKYDLPADELAALLPQLNGVFFTGGATPQIEADGGAIDLLQNCQGHL